MRILILGCGAMGMSTAYYLSLQKEVLKLSLVDACKPPLDQAKKKLSAFPIRKKLAYFHLDIHTKKIFHALLKRHDVIVATLPWSATVAAIQAATQVNKPLISISRPHYPDFYFLSEKLNSRGPLIMLGCGLEPGLTEIIASNILDQFTTLNTLHLRCGGIPSSPKPPFHYKSLFTSQHLPIDPRPAFSICNGELTIVPRFSGIESVLMDGVGKLEAWHDGMLPWLIELPLLKQAKFVSQKTLRWPGFAKLIHLLEQFGFLNKNPVFLQGKSCIPYELTQMLLQKEAAFSSKDRDLTILEIKAEGSCNGRKLSYRGLLRDFFNENEQLTAMARISGFTLGMISYLVGSGEIKGEGLVRPETLIKGLPYQKLLGGLQEAGIQFHSHYSM